MALETNEDRFKPAVRGMNVVTCYTSPLPPITHQFIAMVQWCDVAMTRAAYTSSTEMNKRRAAREADED